MFLNYKIKVLFKSLLLKKLMFLNYKTISYSVYLEKNCNFRLKKIGVSLLLGHTTNYRSECTSVLNPHNCSFERNCFHTYP